VGQILLRLDGLVPDLDNKLFPPSKNKFCALEKLRHWDRIIETQKKKMAAQTRVREVVARAWHSRLDAKEWLSSIIATAHEFSIEPKTLSEILIGTQFFVPFKSGKSHLMLQTPPPGVFFFKITINFFYLRLIYVQKPLFQVLSP
jgi:hypothetical protein